VSRKAQLLLKPPYYPYAISYIDALLRLLRTAPRQLDQYEQASIAELEQLKPLLAEGKIEPPLASFFPDYRNFRKGRPKGLAIMLCYIARPDFVVP